MTDRKREGLEKSNPERNVLENRAFVTKFLFYSQLEVENSSQFSVSVDNKE